MPRGKRLKFDGDWEEERGYLLKIVPQNLKHYIESHDSEEVVIMNLSDIVGDLDARVIKAAIRAYQNKMPMNDNTRKALRRAYNSQRLERKRPEDFGDPI
jgi:FMN-dependent NADH-azoreductase|tara:strand:- start:1136 stop:1435 length:300 start_codon:yes stop_codon:yes gene_type:complete